MNRKWILSSVMILMLLALACGTSAEPTSEAPPEAPPEPTKKVSLSLPTPTVAPPEPEIEETLSEWTCEISSDIKPEWDTVICDTFDENLYGWYEGIDVTDLATVEVAVSDGKYGIDVTGKAHSGYSSGVIQWFRMGNVGDFMVSIDGRIISKNRGVTWGFNFRGKDSNFYSFAVGKEGQYFMDMLKDNEWKRLMNVKTNKAIKWDDAVNNLTIVAEGNKMTFYVNGTLIDTYDSEQSFGDELSIFINVDEGASARIEFDNALLRTNEF